jgi:RND family efflux transporter MFP subunit
VKTRQKLLFLPPLIFGVLVFVLLVRGREKPKRVERPEDARPVRVALATGRAVVPRAVGYGTVEPARSWRAVAEVSGRVTAMHDDLDEGALLPPDTELLRIDDADYRLEIARAEAEVRSIEAQRKKLNASEANYRASLEIERRSTILAEGEHRRLVDLHEEQSVTQSEVDTQQRQVLAHRAGVQAIENALRLLPSERTVLEAELDASNAKLAMARRELERCVITTPFACRITKVDVELMQYVHLGQTMVGMDGIDAAEVTVRFPPGRMAPILHRSASIDFAAAISDGTLWERMGIESTVRLRADPMQAEWEARFVRVSEFMDLRTRTLGIMVEVAKPYEGVRPGVRPPLLRGMFVEVEIRGPEIQGHVIVPREALHDGSRVHVVDAENRLEVREVEVAFVQFDEVLIRSGLEDGERVVLSDLTPVIPGMLLLPRPIDEGEGE